MIDALISGKLHQKATERTGASGKPFVTCKVRVPTADGESTFASVIAFDKAVCAALMALDDGDPVAIAGPLTLKTWTDKDGTTHPAVDVVAHVVTTPYHVTRKRTAMSDGAMPTTAGLN